MQLKMLAKLTLLDVLDAAVNLEDRAAEFVLVESGPQRHSFCDLLEIGRATIIAILIPRLRLFFSNRTLRAVMNLILIVLKVAFVVAVGAAQDAFPQNARVDGAIEQRRLDVWV